MICLVQEFLIVVYQDVDACFYIVVFQLDKKQCCYKNHWKVWVLVVWSFLLLLDSVNLNSIAVSGN